MLKIRHYLKYKGHLYLWVQRKTNAFLDVYGCVWKFQGVSQSRNMLQLGVERCGGASPVCTGYVLTIISVKILHRFEETLSTVTHTVVTLMFK